MSENRDRGAFDHFAKHVALRAAQFATSNGNGDSLVQMKWAQVQRDAAAAHVPLPAGDAGFDLLAAAIERATGRDACAGAVQLLGVIGKREGFVFSVHLRDATTAERQICASWRNAGARILRSRAVPIDVLESGDDARIIADAVLDCGLYAVTIVATKGAATASRIGAVRAALAQADPRAARTAWSVPHVSLDALAAVPAAARQWIVVDRAHLFGSAEWALLMRQSAHLVAVGCLAIPAPAPGLTLRHLLPPDSEEVIDANDARTLRATAHALLLRAWGAPDTVLPTCTSVAEAMRAPAPKCSAWLLLQPRVDKDLALHIKKVQQRENSAAAFAVFAGPQRLSELIGEREAGARSRKLLVSTATMVEWSLGQWLHALVFGWRPACIIAPQPYANAYFAAMIDSARHYPRKLAMDYRPALV